MTELERTWSTLAARYGRTECIKGVGIDTEAVTTIALFATDPEAAAHVFTTAELIDCNADPHRLAARWAAKEAVMKALGLGFTELAMQDIGVRTDTNGAPTIELTGSAARAATRLGVTLLVSMTHHGDSASAIALAVTDTHTDLDTGRKASA